MIRRAFLKMLCYLPTLTLLKEKPKESVRQYIIVSPCSMFRGPHKLDSLPIFDNNKMVWLYLVVHPVHGPLQVVGIVPGPTTASPMHFKLGHHIKELHGEYHKEMFFHAQCLHTELRRYFPSWSSNMSMRVLVYGEPS